MSRAASLSAAAALLLSAGAACAQTTPTPGATGESASNFTAVGTVPDQCLLGEPTNGNGAPAINVDTVIGRVVTIRDLVDPETLSTQAASIALSFDAMCNYPYQLTIESENNGLFRQSTTDNVPAGFANGVPYRARVQWGDVNAELDADAMTRAESRARVSSNEAVAGTLTLTLGVLRGATNITTRAPLLAGDYRDTIRITLGPK